MKIRRVVVNDDGRLAEAVYYVDERETARETYDSDGKMLSINGIIPDGKVTEYYSTGEIKKEFHFTDNKACGESVTYYSSGEVWERNNFDHGMRHGTCKLYQRDGRLSLEAQYRSGELHGLCQSYSRNGNLQKVAEYVNGKLHGPYERYDSFGFPIEKLLFNRGKQVRTFTVYKETEQVHGVTIVIENRIICGEEGS
jgi:antitoxin component YwqK of YwqJK toxin-antitoxin module